MALYLAQDLINAAPFSRDTYFRRMRELNKEKKIKFKLNGNYMTEDEAKLIADKLGFAKEFDEYLVKQQKSK